MANVVIFGMRDNASLAHLYLNHDSEHQVVGFTVNREFCLGVSSFEGKPVVPFEELEESFPPDEYHLFAPLSGKKMNRPRESIYQQIKGRGYPMISYISSRATVLPKAKIGENCFILEGNTIQPQVNIGDNVILWSGNHIGHHSIVEAHVFFSSQVVLSGHCRVAPYSYFGVNSAVGNHLSIAEGTFVSMGAVVTVNTQPWSVYRGNPARKLKISSEDVGV